MREQFAKQSGRTSAGAVAPGRPVGVDELVEALVGLLDELAEEHDRLDAAAAVREGAVRHADMRLLASCVGNESEIVRRIAQAEARRAPVVRFFAERFGAASDDEVSASWIAARLEEAARERVLESAARLRAAIERVQRRNEAARVAAETLAAHMQGLIRSAERRLSHTGTYGRRGAVEAGARVLSTMDVTT